MVTKLPLALKKKTNSSVLAKILMVTKLPKLEDIGGVGSVLAKILMVTKLIIIYLLC